MNKYTDENYVNSIFQKLYPVGSIYLSTNSTNPSILFEFGKWEQIKDVFLLAAGSSYAAGSTGGETEHNHTYRVGSRVYYGSTVGEDFNAVMVYDYPTSTWKIGTKDEVEGGKETRVNSGLTTTYGTGSSNPYFYGSEGNTKVASNMPPYLTVYMWKRTG